jgi:hypothetical protein
MALPSSFFEKKVIAPASASIDACGFLLIGL